MRTYRQVTDFEPAVADFLARHRERLIAPETPRGLWVCEEDGEVLLAMTVYTEPYLRVSVIIDKPETRPFASLRQLAATFEEFAKSAGITSYTVVTDRVDDSYCKIIERRGGILLRENGRWAEYLHEIDQTPDTRDGIRPWRPSDWKALRPVVSAALRAPDSLGACFQATRKNTEAAIRIGMKSAAKGDPCLVAYADGKLAGFSLWFGFAGPLELRERVCSAAGLVVVPDAPAGTTEQLRLAATEAARQAGYTRVDCMLYGPAQLASWQRAGAEVHSVVARLAVAAEPERQVAP